MNTGSFDQHQRKKKEHSQQEVMRVHDGQICLAGKVTKLCKFSIKHAKYHGDNCIKQQPYSRIV